MRGTSHRFASSRPIPSALAERAVDGLLVELLGRVEERAALRGELVELEAEALGRARGRSARRARGSAARVVLDGLEVERVQVLLGQSSRIARSSRSRLSRSGSFAIVGRSIRNGTVSPSTVDLELGLERGELLGVRARQLAEVALAGEAPELADAAVAVDGRAERCACSSSVRSACRS